MLAPPAGTQPDVAARLAGARVYQACDARGRPQRGRVRRSKGARHLRQGSTDDPLPHPGGELRSRLVPGARFTSPIELWQVVHGVPKGRRRGGGGTAPAPPRPALPLALRASRMNDP